MSWNCIFNRSRVICLALAAMLGLPGAASQTGAPVTVADFYRLSISGPGEAILIAGDQPEVVVEADPELRNHIRIESRGGRLRIGLRDWRGKIDHPPRYRITYRRLSEVDSSGSIQVRADRISSPKLAISASGSGRVEIGQLEVTDLEVSRSGSGAIELESVQAEDLDLRNSGSAKVRAAGRVESCTLKISGSGEIDAAQLNAGEMEVSISGSGEAVVRAATSLCGSVSGSGGIRY